jgi:hypothetical protein
VAYTTVAFTPGAGANINVDRVSGNDFQRTKPAWGVEGSAVDASLSNPLPIQDTQVSSYHLVTAASTNAANIKASPGILRGVHVFNVAAYPIYVKFHNTAGTPTAGAGVVFTVGVQAGGVRDVQLAGRGRAFGTGIGITVVKLMPDSDATAVVANDAQIEVLYE